VNSHAKAHLGRSQVLVTRLGLGTAPLGGLFAPVAHEDALRTIDAAWQGGIRFFDTAPLYGHGLAEMRLGEALARHPRESYVVATKVGRLLEPMTPTSVESAHYKGTPPVEPMFDFSYDGVMRSVDESLARLKLDRVDILHIHDPDDHCEAALGGAHKALAKLRREGTIGAVGAGMNQWQMLQRFAEEADFDCFLLAGRYTLLDRSGEPLLDLCGERGVDVVLGGVFNSGLLIDPRPGAWFDYAPASADLLARAQRMREIAASAGYDLAACALAFAAAHPAVTSVLVGATSAGQVRANADAFRREVPPDLLPRLVSC